MKHTETEIKAVALKIMEDLEKDYYYKDQIYINFEETHTLLWGGGEVKNCWSVALITPDFQFGASDGAGISIYIDDETGEVYEYREGPGRPVPLTVKLNNEGKYEFATLDNIDYSTGRVKK